MGSGPWSVHPRGQRWCGPMTSIPGESQGGHDDVWMLLASCCLCILLLLLLVFYYCFIIIFFLIIFISSPSLLPSNSTSHPLFSPSPCTLRWGEVDFLLRKRIESEEDIVYTTAAAEAGMLFIDQVRLLHSPWDLYFALRSFIHAFALVQDFDTSPNHKIFFFNPKIRIIHLKNRMRDVGFRYCISFFSSFFNLILPIFFSVFQLNSLAKSLNILRGTLSRWLLPYDNNTRIDEQCSTPHSVVDNMPEMVRGKISERQVHYLVAGANGVRRLVRIKIADDNDLEQARVALLTTINFFKKLQIEATKNNLTNFQLFGYRTWRGK